VIGHCYLVSLRRTSGIQRPWRKLVSAVGPASRRREPRNAALAPGSATESADLGASFQSGSALSAGNARPAQDLADIQLECCSSDTASRCGMTAIGKMTERPLLADRRRLCFPIRWSRHLAGSEANANVNRSSGHQYFSFGYQSVPRPSGVRSSIDHSDAMSGASRGS